MLRALGRSSQELSVLLTNDAALRELNKVHRGVDRSTDVLAFPMEALAPEHDLMAGLASPSPTGLLGDIAISVDRARLQAPRVGRTIIGEVSFLLAHGLLHLVGFDHRTPDETRRMNAKTDVLVTAVAER